MRRREVLLGLLGACVAWPVQLRTASAPSRSGMLAACAPEPSRPAVASGQPNAVDDAQSSHNTRDSPSATRAGQLLDALDFWLRRETIESVLPRAQAKALLTDLRDDRRFWAQQRKQFAVVWVSVEAAMREEVRPLSTVVGPDTTARLLHAVEHMDDDPALVNAVLRSEVVGAPAPRGVIRTRSLALALALSPCALTGTVIRWWSGFLGIFCTRASSSLSNERTSSATLSTSCR